MAEHTPLFNVKDFGAVGDGITNDTAAFQKAAAAACGDLGVPRGEYPISGTLDLKNTRIVGQDEG